MSYIIISDLHIGGDTNLDIFHSQDHLASFLRSLGSEPLTLVINGDFIDFLAVKPFGKFSRDSAKKKIAAIITATSNKDLWAAFRSLLGAHKQNRIDILLGNHDVELVFEEVQEAMRKVMAAPGEGDRIRFITDRLSHPDIKVGNVPIHIEHGFQYDLFNWYDHNKLILSTMYKKPGTSFKLPLGSKLVYEVLNELTPDHAFIPLLKPMAAVFWLMVALAPGKVLRKGLLLPEYAGEALTSMLRKRRAGIKFGGGRQLARATLETRVLELQLVNMLYDENLDDDALTEIEEFLTKGTGKEKPSARTAFALNLRLKGKLRLIRRALKSMKYEQETFFDATQRDEFEGALNKILDLGAKVAILGHSHGKKMLRLPKPDDPQRELLYLNTGTWADLLDYDLAEIATDDGLQTWMDKMEKKQFQPTLIFTFVRLQELPNGRGVKVSLEEWRDHQMNLVEPPQDVLP
jgi:UDP-2,3-diacylglucosamine pyrophosphatase LpxH